MQLPLQLAFQNPGNSLHGAVIDVLRKSSYPALWNLQCEVLDNEVVVSGVVPSYFLKQMAQTVILKVQRVKAVHNRLEVRTAAWTKQERLD